MEAQLMPSNMTKRLAVYLPDGVYDFLEKWSDAERRSVSNLAAVLLEMAVREREGWQLSQVQSTQPNKEASQ